MGGKECSFLFCLHLSRPRPRNLYAHIARLYAPHQGGHIIEQTKYKADQHVCVSMSAISSDPSQMIESGTSELVSGATKLYSRPHFFPKAKETSKQLCSPTTIFWVQFS